MYAKCFKRVLDFVLSLIALIVLSPVLLILAIAVRWEMGAPVFFKQKRAGANKTEFYLYKFRTMTNEKDAQGNFLPDADRMHPFGNWLRNTSMDELPELVNILRGDMSIVGPRPLLMKDMVFLEGPLENRWKVRPGLTGLAQVSGRNALSWDSKLNVDVAYVEKLSMWTDVKIILQTIVKVFEKSDVDYDGSDAEADYGDWLLESGKISREQYDAVKDTLSV